MYTVLFCLLEFFFNSFSFLFVPCFWYLSCVTEINHDIIRGLLGSADWRGKPGILNWWHPFMPLINVIVLNQLKCKYAKQVVTNISSYS